MTNGFRRSVTNMPKFRDLLRIRDQREAYRLQLAAYSVSALAAELIAYSCT
jgi:hypothetical protein